MLKGLLGDLYVYDDQEGLHIAASSAGRVLQAVGQRRLCRPSCSRGWAYNPSRTLSSGWETQVPTAVDRPAAVLKQGKELLPYMKRAMHRRLSQLDRDAIRLATPSIQKVDCGALLESAESEEEAWVIIAAALSQRLSQALFSCWHTEAVETSALLRIGESAMENLKVDVIQGRDIL
ncbi:hypothetical protein BDV10DRAFT_188503 [Aspergillus recurvatus]